MEKREKRCAGYGRKNIKTKRQKITGDLIRFVPSYNSAEKGETRLSGENVGMWNVTGLTIPLNKVITGKQFYFVIYDERSSDIMKNYA